MSTTITSKIIEFVPGQRVSLSSTEDGILFERESRAETKRGRGSWRIESVLLVPWDAMREVCAALDAIADDEPIEDEPEPEPGPVKP